MTTVLPARVPAGIPGGGRFAPKACRTAYAALDSLAAAADVLPPGWSIDPDNPQRVHLPWGRCPHGHVAPWAIAACPGCRTTTPPVSSGGAAACSGRTTAGDPCTRRTTRRDSHGSPACHHHGGHATPAV